MQTRAWEGDVISFAAFLVTIQSIWNEIAVLDEKSGDDQSN